MTRPFAVVSRLVCLALVLIAEVGQGQDIGAQRSPCPRADSGQAGVRVKLDLNAAVTKATVDAQVYGADLVIENNRHPEACGWRRQRTRVRVTPNYDSKKKENAAPIITRSYIGSLQQLAYLPGNRFYLSGSGRYLHNNSLGVYLQQVYTLVLGTEVETTLASMEFDAGPAFVGQNFMLSEPSTDFVAASVSELVSIPLDFIATGAELSENVRVTIPFASGDPWLATAYAGLRLPISQRVAINFSAFYDYLENAPSGFEKNYLTTTVGVSIKLGRL